nr:MFS transporter [Salsipaludibacter albus]
MVSFGTWFYGFGVLVDALADDGIGEAVSGPTYGAMLLLGGIGSLLAGRVLDRRGGRRVFALGAPVVAIGTLLTVWAGSAGRPWAFAVAAALTGGVVGALGYYSLLHATIVALYPQDRTRAVTVNTLWGAFASPVFLPAMGLVVERWSWQAAVLAANVAVVVAFVVVALVLPPDVTTAAAPEPESPSEVGSWRRLVPLLVVAAGGGAATAVLLLYQVPAMVDAGLALGVASGLAGVRGAAQVAGRLPLPALVRRVGTGPTMVGSLALVAVAALLLTAAGQLPIAIAFVVVGGLAVGALTTVENLFVPDVLATTTIGAALGAISVARGIGGALGPTLAGLATAQSGTRDLALVAVAVVAVATAVVVAAITRGHPATRAVRPDHG